MSDNKVVVSLGSLFFLFNDSFGVRSRELLRKRKAFQSFHIRDLLEKTTRFKSALCSSFVVELRGDRLRIGCCFCCQDLLPAGGRAQLICARALPKPLDNILKIVL